MTITALPDPPTRLDPVNFRSRADALLTALTTFVTEANDLAASVNADKTATEASVDSAMLAGLASAASNAAAAAASASAAAGYAATVGTYSAGTDPAQNPLNYLLGSMAYVNQTWLYASATWDPASVAAAGAVSTTVAVPGAAVGDFVLVARSSSSGLVALVPEVTAAGVVTVTYFNPTGGAIDMGSHTVYLAVLKRTPR